MDKILAWLWLADAVGSACQYAQELLELYPDPVELYDLLRTGSEAPPAANSHGSGQATVRIDTETKKVTWDIAVKDLTGDPTAAHIHGPAGAGVNAPPLVDMSANIMKGEGTVTDQQLADIQAGQTYINVHTAKYPDGEIRGQLLR